MYSFRKGFKKKFIKKKKKKNSYTYIIKVVGIVN